MSDEQQSNVRNVMVVDPALMNEVLNVLQEELPMRKVRGLVQALESCGVAQLPAQEQAPVDAEND